MQLSWLFTWWNAVYSIPLAVVLILLTMTSVFGLAGGMVEAGHAGAEGVNTDVDVDLDLEVDADAGGEASLEGDAGHSGHAAPWMGPLLFIGAGKAPLSLVLQVLFLFWGTIGLTFHQVVQATGPSALLGSVPVTLFLSLVFTRGVATLVGKVYRPVETASLKRRQLVGSTGQVVYPVTDSEGTVHIRDQHGTLHRVRARTESGRLESGQEIIVLGYDSERSVYQVDDSRTFVDRI